MSIGDALCEFVVEDFTATTTIIQISCSVKLKIQENGMIKIEIGSRLRIVLGMQTQVEFAREMQTTPQTLNNYLAGLSFPSEDFLIRLAKLKKVNLHWFITGEGQVYVEPAKNANAAEQIPELVGMKVLTDQFISKVAETVVEYKDKAKKLEARKKVK